MENKTVVADASVLINFLRLGRMDLIRDHPSSFVTTAHVAGEVQAGDHDFLYAAALSGGCLEQLEGYDSAELTLYTDLGDAPELGPGERSAAAVALVRDYSLAIDDKRAIWYLTQLAHGMGASLTIVRTQDIIVDLINGGVIGLAEADRMLRDWRSNHRFALNISSFGELIK